MKFNVYDSVNEEEGRQFIKHIAAEDGTEFRAVAFVFPRSRIKTLAECLDDGAYTVELNHPAVNSHDGLVSFAEYIFSNEAERLRTCQHHGSVKLPPSTYQVKAKAALDAVKETK